MEEFNKMDALKYLVEHDVICDEWSGAGMYNALVDVIISEKDIFNKDYLDDLLKKASNF